MRLVAPCSWWTVWLFRARSFCLAMRTVFSPIRQSMSDLRCGELQLEFGQFVQANPSVLPTPHTISDFHVQTIPHCGTVETEEPLRKDPPVGIRTEVTGRHGLDRRLTSRMDAQPCWIKHAAQQQCCVLVPHLMCFVCAKFHGKRSPVHVLAMDHTWCEAVSRGQVGVHIAGPQEDREGVLDHCRGDVKCVFRFGSGGD